MPTKQSPGKNEVHCMLPSREKFHMYIQIPNPCASYFSAPWMFYVILFVLTSSMKRAWFVAHYFPFSHWFYSSKKSSLGFFHWILLMHKNILVDSCIFFQSQCNFWLIETALTKCPNLRNRNNLLFVNTYRNWITLLRTLKCYSVVCAVWKKVGELPTT